MPIPYMGSKRAIANMIYNIINQREKKSTFIDLFCGGFAVGEVFLKNGWHVIANDKNKYIIDLLKKTINNELPKDIASKFITSAEYKEAMANKDKYDDWYIGYLMCIWSFGNNQKGYMYGKEIEPRKKALYELVFNNDETELLKHIKIEKKYIDVVKKQKDWGTKIIALQRIKKGLARLQSLERLQSIQSLQGLTSLQSLQIYTKNYKDIEIIKDAVVYCDPPYINTATYNEANFNHTEFYDWVRNISKTNSVYISEYQAPEDFKPIMVFNKRSLLCGSKTNQVQPSEKLFIHEDLFKKHIKVIL